MAGGRGNCEHLRSSFFLADITGASRSSKVLANYIASKYTSLSGHQILELGPSVRLLPSPKRIRLHPSLSGAGTGLVGLVAGMLGANVIVTDQKCVLTVPFIGQGAKLESLLVHCNS
jgi:hypothetical protein